MAKKYAGGFVICCIDKTTLDHRVKKSNYMDFYNDKYIYISIHPIGAKPFANMYAHPSIYNFLFLPNLRKPCALSNRLLGTTVDHRDLRDSILTKQRHVDANLEKCNRDFLTRVKCSREIMSKIDAMYDRAKSAFDLEIATLNISFGDVRRSRDEYMQAMKNETVPSQIMKDLTTPLQYNHRFILDSFQNNRN